MSDPESRTLLSVGIFLFVLGLAIFTFLEDRTKEYVVRESDWDRRPLRRLIDKYSSLVNDVGSVDFLGDEEKRKITERLKIEFVEGIYNQIDSEDFNSIKTDDEIEAQRLDELFRVLQDLSARIIGEISSLSVRANLNLSIGSITTLTSVAVLIYFTQKVPTTFKDSIALLSFYIPRLSVVVFVEVFAFFFLRLYRSNLLEVKYYRNEVTNVDHKLTALKTAMILNQPEITKLVIQDFLKVERNSILKRGETTVEIETSKHQQENDRWSMDYFRALLDSMSKLKLVGRLDEKK